MSCRSVRAAAVTLILTASLIVTPRASADATQEQWKIIELAEGIHGWVWSDPLVDPIEGNALFIINDEDVVVVDTGLYPSTARRMIAELRKLTDNPVRYVVNTHWHDDHHGGNDAYLESWPAAEIIAHPMTRTDIIEQCYAPRPGVLASYRERIATIERWLAQGHDDDGKGFDDSRRQRAMAVIDLLERTVDELSSLPPRPPTLLVDDGLVLERGKRTIEIRWLGEGNTRGDLVVFLPAERIVATGDLLVHPIPFGIGSNYSEWIDTLEALDALEADILFPGHGPVFHDRAYLRDIRDLLADLIERVDASVAEGLTLEQTQERVTLSDWKTKLAGDDPLRERSFDAYFVAPAVKRAWEIANGVALEAEGLYGE